MSDLSNKSLELHADMAAWINAAAPKLEKLASLEAELEKIAGTIATDMKNAGVIPASGVEKVASEIKTAGFTKIAQSFSFTISQLKANVPVGSMGKAASVNHVSDAPVSANDKFAHALGFTTN